MSRNGCLRICAGLMAIIEAGCFSSRVAWVDGKIPQKPYTFVSDVHFTGDSSSILNRCVSCNTNDLLEVEVSCRLDSERDGVGFWGSVNNILSCLSLCIWPRVSADEYDYTVMVSGYGKTAERKFSVGNRSWTSFLLPVAAIPCPGWGDWRSYPRCNPDWFDSDDYKAWRSEIVAGCAGELMTDAFVGELVDGKKVEEQRRAEGMSLLRAALDSPRSDLGKSCNSASPGNSPATDLQISVAVREFSVVSCSEAGELVLDMPNAGAQKGDVVDLYSREPVNGTSRSGDPLSRDVKVAEVTLVDFAGNVVIGKFGNVMDTSRPWQNVFVRKRPAPVARKGSFVDIFKAASRDYQGLSDYENDKRDRGDDPREAD